MRSKVHILRRPSGLMHAAVQTSFGRRVEGIVSPGKMELSVAQELRDATRHNGRYQAEGCTNEATDVAQVLVKEGD